MAIRAREKKERPADESVDEDPDIAGIVPGPQPLPEEMRGLVEDEDEDEDEETESEEDRGL